MPFSIKKHFMLDYSKPWHPALSPCRSQTLLGCRSQIETIALWRYHCHPLSMWKAFGSCKTMPYQAIFTTQPWLFHVWGPSVKFPSETEKKKNLVSPATKQNAKQGCDPQFWSPQVIPTKEAVQIYSKKVGWRVRLVLETDQPSNLELVNWGRPWRHGIPKKHQWNRLQAYTLRHTKKNVVNW